MIGNKDNLTDNQLFENFSHQKKTFLKDKVQREYKHHKQFAKAFYSNLDKRIIFEPENENGFWSSQYQEEKLK